MDLSNPLRQSSHPLPAVAHGEELVDAGNSHGGEKSVEMVGGQVKDIQHAGIYVAE